MDPMLGSLVCEHEIRNIDCACQDADDLNHFAYITKDHHTSSHYSHVFSVSSMVRLISISEYIGEFISCKKKKKQFTVRYYRIKRPKSF